MTTQRLLLLLLPAAWGSVEVSPQHAARQLLMFALYFSILVPPGSSWVCRHTFTGGGPACPPVSPPLLRVTSGMFFIHQSDQRGKQHGGSADPCAPTGAQRGRGHFNTLVFVPLYSPLHRDTLVLQLCSWCVLGVFFTCGWGRSPPLSITRVF